MYQLKYLLCVIMLMPTLWLNLHGIYCKKQESFGMMRERFSDHELEILLSASNIRSVWRDKKMPGNKIPAWIKSELGKDYLKRASQFALMLRDSIE